MGAVAAAAASPGSGAVVKDEKTDEMGTSGSRMNPVTHIRAQASNVKSKKRRKSA